MAKPESRGASSTVSIPQARKILHDYLDGNRPWARCSDMYVVMEQIVDEAQAAFTGTRRPTNKEYEELEKSLLKITASLQEHPENYEGPCDCAECHRND